jgi:cyclophilin family peptidyl-prolyl cis-trans isomerase
MKKSFLWIFALALTASLNACTPETETNPQVRITTNLGIIDLELFADKAPVSVKNFLEYVEAGFYKGTIFHRVIPGFMIQGGGFEPDMKNRQTRAPIQNEADNGLKNSAGTVAMARTPDPHSASAQFFINVKDNGFLNHTGKTPTGWGYAVFGKVTAGMDVVRKIETVPTGNVGPFQNVPVKHVIIEKAEILKKQSARPSGATDSY